MDNTASKPYAELWTIAENTGSALLSTWADTKEKVELFLHPLQLEGSVRGNDLYEYLKQKKLNVLDATVWQYLKENQNEIPEKWKYSDTGGAQYIYFWGTLDRSPAGDLYVRYLSWSGGNWIFSNFLLSGNWHEDFLAAVLK